MSDYLHYQELILLGQRVCAHHALLSSFPTVQMSENELRTSFQAVPHLDVVDVRLFYESLSTLMEVS